MKFWLQPFSFTGANGNDARNELEKAHHNIYSTEKVIAYALWGVVAFCLTILFSFKIKG